MNKNILYLKYLLKHKWYVFIECCKRGQIWLGITHDLSKFLPCEFIPYSNYFYSNGDRKLFDYAWNHHQKSPTNKHHHQYWVLRQDDGEVKTLEIPEKYIREMVSDWIGAGKAQGYNKPNEVQTWYEANKHKMMLHPNTRTKIENLLKID